MLFQIIGLEGGPSKVKPILSPLPRGTSHGKKFREGTPTSPEVIGAHTLNFNPSFLFTRSKVLAGPLSRL